MDGVIAWWRSPDTKIVLPIHLATRLGVLFVGFLAVILIGFPPEAVSRWKIYSNDFLDLPARWDTGWYLSIATEGYQYFRGAAPDFQQNVAFFPAFPMSMRYLSILLGRQPLWTGVGISIVSFYFALTYFLRLSRDLLKDEEQAVTGGDAAGGLPVRGVLQRGLHRRIVPAHVDGRGLSLPQEPAGARVGLGIAVRPDAPERFAAVDRAGLDGGSRRCGMRYGGGRSCRRRRAGARSFAGSWRRARRALACSRFRHSSID
jgi:hypothetical protein